MRALATRIYDRLAGAFGREARGGGRPASEPALDAEYASGRWDYFFGPDEAPRYDLLVRVVRETHARPRVLDVGCGSGRLAALLAGGPLTEYLGVDLSREGLRRAGALGLPAARFVHGDFESWRPDGQWDLIVFNETVGYARDPGRVAAAFARSLAAGGALVVSYFRAGHHLAIWRRLAARFQVTREETVANARGQTWDVKVLRLPS